MLDFSVLEFDLKLVMAPLLGMAFLIAGCGDKQSEPAPQAGEPYSSREPAPDAESKSAPTEPEAAGTLDITHRGEAMPATVFDGPTGAKVKLADFKGKPLLVNLWATWCGPCVAEMPTLDALAVREAVRLQVMVVSQDGEGRAKVDPWWGKQSFKLLKPYLDAKSDLGFAFNTGMVPTKILYDADGKEVWRVIGAMNWDGPRANTLISGVLG
jgi:thiol-disulfide isomerase/thioredoxin